MKHLNKKFHTVSKCLCLDLNQSKLNILHEYSRIIDSTTEKCKDMLIKGYPYKRIYDRMSKDMQSTYKSKCLNVATYMFRKWCKHFKQRPKQTNVSLYGSASKCWVYEKQIKDFTIFEDKSKMFQLRVRFVLPKTINGKKELTLMAQIPAKVVKSGNLDKVYKKGFILNVQKDKVLIHLVQKIDYQPKEKHLVKAIYASPYGGMHVATCENLSNINEQNLKDFYGCNYGVSRESKQCLELINKIRSMEDTANYKKNLNKLEVKIRTRINKLFKNMNDKNCSTFYFIKTTGNVSKVTEFIQNIALQQVEKNCVLHDFMFDIVYVDVKDLDKEAIWCMSKQERQEVQKSERKVTCKFRVIAGLKKFFKEHLNLQVKLGYKRIKQKSNVEVLRKVKQSIVIAMSDNNSDDEYDWS